MGSTLGADMDNKILSLYQWVIDTSQRDRRAWMEVSAGLTFVGSICVALFLMDRWHWFMGVLYSGIAVAYLVMGKSDSFLDAIGSMQIFRVLWVLVLFFDVTIIGLGYLAVDRVPMWTWFELMTDFGFCSIHYFCACKPPEPKRKTKPAYGF